MADCQIEREWASIHGHGPEGVLINEAHALAVGEPVESGNPFAKFNSTDLTQSAAVRLAGVKHMRVILSSVEKRKLIREIDPR